ncbi:MAG: CoA-transferase [Dehalococcoidia bacterium]|nr:CoA-transferase [Dehalococcoidia bacterium]
MDEYKRKSKLGDVESALDLISDGMYVAFGGHVFFNKPSYFVRAMVKRGFKDLTISGSPYASYEFDLPIGAGMVKKVMAGNCGFEYMGFAPNFRKAATTGSVEVAIGDEATIVGGYMATVEGLPYHPINSVRGSDVAKYSTLIKEYIGPFGDRLYACKALHPDVVILHAPQGDEYGNIRYYNSIFFERIMAKIGKKVIVTVDEIIPHHKVRSEPEKTMIPGFLVTTVIHAPYGAHPCQSTGQYAHDEDHIKDYIDRGRASASGANPQPFAEYLQKYCYEPKDIYDYIDRAGGMRRMEELRRKWIDG